MTQLHCTAHFHRCHDTHVHGMYTGVPVSAVHEMVLQQHVHHAVAFACNCYAHLVTVSVGGHVHQRSVQACSMC